MIIPAPGVSATKPTTLLAVWSGKLAIALSRGLGMGGSTFPGAVARRVDPGVLRALAAATPQGVLVVSGTNGKTTTSKMLSDICGAAGLRPVHNRAGANLLGGLIASYVRSASLGGRPGGDVALMEVDEATMPRAVPDLAPRAAVVTNFLRDQLDRYGELDTTLSFVRQGLARMPVGAQAALNADDPLCASLGDAGPAPLYYGVEDPAAGTAEMHQSAEARQCRRCGHPYEYSVYYYAQLGKYRCPACGQERPQPAVYATAVALAARGSRFRLVTPLGESDIALNIPGLYNIYNALAAAAGALILGLSLPQIKQGLEATTSHFGRMESFKIQGRDVYMALVKNPVGFNEVLRTVLGSTQTHLIIAINDLYADGTDVSWLWDVDFEQLGAVQERLPGIICAGTRAEDMAVRLKYAGIDPARLSTVSDLGKALDTGLRRAPPGGLLYILPTYTAMLGMRRIVAKRGYARQFWEV